MLGGSLRLGEEEGRAVVPVVAAANFCSVVLWVPCVFFLTFKSVSTLYLLPYLPPSLPPSTLASRLSLSLLCFLPLSFLPPSLFLPLSLSSPPPGTFILGLLCPLESQLNGGARDGQELGEHREYGGDPCPLAAFLLTHRGLAEGSSELRAPGRWFPTLSPPLAASVLGW